LYSSTSSCYAKASDFARTARSSPIIMAGRTSTFGQTVHNFSNISYSLRPVLLYLRLALGIAIFPKSTTPRHFQSSHQTYLSNSPGCPIPSSLSKKTAPVRIILKDLFALYPSYDDMLERSWGIYSGSAWHTRHIP